MRQYFKTIKKTGYLLFILFATTEISNAQQKEEASAPYQMLAPKTWAKEHFTLPPEFAPDLKWTGEEELRLHPGWADPKSVGHFSYVYLWWLEGSVAVNPVVLKENFQIYFSGLVNRFVKIRHITADKLVQTKAVVSKVATSKGDKQTYKGVIHMLDFFTTKATDLYVDIHLLDVAIQGKTAIRVNISPMQRGSEIWKELAGVKIESNGQKRLK
jgi:hypothetical protein